MPCLSEVFLRRASPAKLNLMFMHLSPKERFGYVALAAVFLAGVGFVTAKNLRRPAKIELHQTQQPPVAFDHGSSRDQANGSPHTDYKSNAELIVDVAGAVKRPGLVSLPPGSRLFDAIQAAGGPTEDANIDAVNLAAKASDGVQVYVPRFGSPSLGASPPGTSGPHARGEKHPAGVIDLNSADITQLTSLPGIGAATAQRIIDYRVEHGLFRGVDDLIAVQGFTRKKSKLFGSGSLPNSNPTNDHQDRLG